jgi:hypothetical protein
MVDTILFWLALNIDVFKVLLCIVVFGFYVCLSLYLRSGTFFFFGLAMCVLGYFIIPSTKQAFMIYGFHKVNERQLIDKSLDAAGKLLDNYLDDSNKEKESNNENKGKKE